MKTTIQADLARALVDAAPGGVTFDAPLNEWSRWRIGGPAWALVEPESPGEAAKIIQILNGRPEPLVIVGDTSNILFDSAGFEGVLLRIGTRMSRFAFDEQAVRAEAGVSVPLLARAAAEAGLTGIEHTAGIPGTLGGLVAMNGGSQRKGIGTHVREALCIDEHGDVTILKQADFDFSYRRSSVQDRRRFAILEVTLDLEEGDPKKNVAAIDEILLEREGKFPLDLPNCGSTFLSDPAFYPLIGPPGRAIEDAGLKGVSRGGAQISPRHANFIVNRGDATDREVLWLIALVRETVHSQTGFYMNCEVRHLSAQGAFRPAHEAANLYWSDITPYGK